MSRDEQVAARVLRCPMCGQPIPAGTGLLNHYCTGKPMSGQDARSAASTEQRPAGSLRAALNAGAAALRRYRPGKTGEDQASLLEEHARQLRKDWRLVERWCERYPDDWRLVFKRGDEVLEVSVPEDVWRAFDLQKPLQVGPTCA